MLSFLLALLFTAPAAPAAPDTTAPGLLLMAHGGGPEWNAAVEAAVAPLRGKYPVAIAFGMADPNTLGDALDALRQQGARRVAVVRLFLDGRSFLHQTEYFLGLRADPPERFLLHSHGSPAADDQGGHHGPAASTHAANTHAASTHGSHHGPAAAHDASHGAHHAATSGDDHAGHHGSAATDAQPQPLRHDLTLALSHDGLMQAKEVAAILATRAGALSREPAAESVLVLAHGTGDDVENARWITAMEHLSGAVRALGFHSVRAETLREDWPDRRVDAERRIRSFVEAETEDGRSVLVVPFRLAGFGPYREVLDGLDYRAADAGLLPHEAVTDWIAAQYRSIVAREGWDVSE